MSASSGQYDQTLNLLTVKEVVPILRKSKSSVYRLKDDRLIPHYKVGQRILFSRKDVENYLNGCRIEAIK